MSNPRTAAINNDLVLTLIITDLLWSIHSIVSWMMGIIEGRNAQ